MAQNTVLVIDDDPAIRTLISRLVELLGFRSVTAAHGSAGIQLFRKQRKEIACVLLDAVMPVMNGAETMRELRRLDVDVPVFVVSGQERDELEELFASALPEQFIPKPCDGEELLAVLNAWHVFSTQPTTAGAAAC